MNINLELNQIGLIFANAESRLMEGEKIYFGQRQMLYAVFNQLPPEGKEFLFRNCPNVFETIMMR